MFGRPREVWVLTGFNAQETWDPHTNLLGIPWTSPRNRTGPRTAHPPSPRARLPKTAFSGAYSRESKTRGSDNQTRDRLSARRMTIELSSGRQSDSRREKDTGGS